MVVVLNMTPASYEHFRIGVPQRGSYSELLNTEKDIYDGCNMCNYEPVKSEDIPMHHFEQSIDIRVAPFAGILFFCRKQPAASGRKKTENASRSSGEAQTSISRRQRTK